MDKSRKQKQREEHVLIKFISELRLPVVSIKGSETPDFYMTVLDQCEEYKEKLVSVEVTDLIDPKLKHREAIQDRIIELAKKRFINDFPYVNLRVYVGFENYFLPDKKPEINNIANELFLFVSSVYKNNSKFEFRVHQDYNIDIKGIKDISISNEENFMNWQSFGAYSVPFAKKEWLLERIKKKNQLISKYQNKSDEKWLLIVSGHGHESSGFQIDDMDLSKEDILFDKIYVFEYMSKGISKLK